MADITAGIAATIITVPLIGLYIIYFITVKTTKKKMFSFKLAVDLSVFLFMLSVYFLFLEIWNFRTGGLIVLFILLTATAFTFYHWKIHEELNMKKVFKGVWRFQFVIFTFLYIVLLVYGMVDRVLA